MALVLVCSLSGSPAASSSELLGRQLLDALGEQDATGTLLRLVDHDVRPGVELDMGDGDEWPSHSRPADGGRHPRHSHPHLDGQPSSIAKRVLERLDAELSETDGAGRLQTYGKVAVAAVVGNEDRAHHISGILFQCLSDVGLSLPAEAVTYWNNEVKGE